MLVEDILVVPMAFPAAALNSMDGDYVEAGTCPLKLSRSGIHRPREDKFAGVCAPPCRSNRLAVLDYMHTAVQDRIPADALGGAANLALRCIMNRAPLSLQGCSLHKRIMDDQKLFDASGGLRAGIIAEGG